MAVAGRDHGVTRVPVRHGFDSKLPKTSPSVETSANLKPIGVSGSRAGRHRRAYRDAVKGDEPRLAGD
jgi:hypothetical protein